MEQVFASSKMYSISQLNPFAPTKVDNFASIYSTPEWMRAARLIKRDRARKYPPPPPPPLPTNERDIHTR